jgi:23S rRNA (pseudouridine1915-N3)-methyltransferase
MYKIKIFSIGKTKEAWLSDAISEYEKRLKTIMPIDWIFAKNNAQLTAFLEKESPFIALVPSAKEVTSRQFASHIHLWLERFGSRLNFVIGGAEGIPSQIEGKAFQRLSLSKLTFTHQIARLILVEQLYRAGEIQKGSEYHK